MLRHPKALPGWGETPPPPASQPLGTAQGPAGNRPSAARPVRASPPHRPCTQQVTPFCLSHQGPGTQQPPRSPEPQNDPGQPPPSAHWPTRLREHVPPAPACHQSLRRTPRQGPAWRPCLSFLGDCERHRTFLRVALSKGRGGTQNGQEPRGQVPNPGLARLTLPESPLCLRRDGAPHTLALQGCRGLSPSGSLALRRKGAHQPLTLAGVPRPTGHLHTASLVLSSTCAHAVSTRPRRKNVPKHVSGRDGPACCGRLLAGG